MSQSAGFIKTPTFSEVEASFINVTGAISDHSKWLAEWNTKVLCGISERSHCDYGGSYGEYHYGNWLNGEHSDFLEYMPEFIAIKELYNKVYEGIQSTIRKVNSGESITYAEYKYFIDAEMALSESIQNFRDELYKLLLSFDYLTGTLNRQAFFRILEQEYARITRFGEAGCIVLLDIDNFKSINDRFGHAAGDRTLVSIADFIIENMRPYDSICRYGGEEFLICMPKTTIDIAHKIIDRVREDLSNKKIWISRHNYITASASFGISSMSAEEEFKETIVHADDALYHAKTNGRNKVGVWWAGKVKQTA